MDETLGPHERIRKRKDFFHIYKKGSRFKGRYFILVYLSNGLTSSRLAVVASKKIGNAVVRNQIKRQLRTLFRTHKHLLPGNYDLVFIARKEISNATWEKKRSEYLHALESLPPLRQK